MIQAIPRPPNQIKSKIRENKRTATNISTRKYDPKTVQKHPNQTNKTPLIINHDSTYHINRLRVPAYPIPTNDQKEKKYSVGVPAQPAATTPSA